MPGGGATLIAVAVLLAAAGVWELAGSRGEEVGRALRSTAESLSGGRLRTLAEAALWLRIPERLERAGLAERVTIGAVLAGKLGGAALGEQLHEQASSLRRDARRRIEEQAARAAPKIQLVVALVLVPSVLLMILAGLVANSDALFGAL